MRLLVTGASGLLGYKIVHQALRRGYNVFSAYKDHPVSLGKPIKLDLTSYSKVYDVVSELKPDVIIHTAAYTNVDGCEVNRDLAWSVNAEVTKHVALASSKVNAHLIYVSTDYIFNGEKGFYSEEDTPHPINYYGHTKLKGEEFVRQYAESWCIARTSGLYGWGREHRPNFATFVINNLKQSKEVKAIIDQHLSPTLNSNLAGMLIEVAKRRLTGLFHLAGASRVSRHDFVLELAKIFDLNGSLIKPVTMSEFSWRAKRPRDSSLKVGKAHSILGTKPIKLQEALTLMKSELGLPTGCANALQTQ